MHRLLSDAAVTGSTSRNAEDLAVVARSHCSSAPCFVPRSSLVHERGEANCSDDTPQFMNATKCVSLVCDKPRHDDYKYHDEFEAVDCE